jgi:hypothetical protein
MTGFQDPAMNLFDDILRDKAKFACCDEKRSQRSRNKDGRRKNLNADETRR